MLKREQTKGSFLLLLTAIIWGSAFVAQEIASRTNISPFLFNGIRFFLAGIILFLCFPIFDKVRHFPISFLGQGEKKEHFSLVGISAFSGVLLGFACAFQQVAFSYGTNAGKSAFLTTFYIIFVPILGIFLKKRAGWNIWCAIIIAMIGAYFLSVSEQFTFALGDILTVCGALFYAIQILVLDKYSKKLDCFRLCAIQYCVCGILNFIFALIFRVEFSWHIIQLAILPILYTAIFSAGIANTLQVIGQKYSNPVIGSLIMSLEGAFSLLFGWIILRTTFSLREIVGCLIMFFAVILAQIPFKSKKQEKEREKVE